LLILQLAVGGLLVGGSYALVGLGLTFIYRNLGLFNFAHGDYLMVSMYVTYGLWQAMHIDPYLTMLLNVPIMFAIGAATYALVIRWTQRASHLVQVFVTFGISIIAENALLLLVDGNPRSVTPSYTDSTLSLGSIQISVTALAAFGASAVATTVLALLLYRTRFGKALRATGSSSFAAELAGIDTSKMRMAVFATGTATLGVAGTVLAPIYSVYPTFGATFILIVFVLVVVGGLGSLVGALVAGVALGILQAIGGYYLNPNVEQALFFALLIAVLALRPRGLFGSKEILAR
jgi:branched-chain amino acid transport system permease protein